MRSEQDLLSDLANAAQGIARTFKIVQSSDIARHAENGQYRDDRYGWTPSANDRTRSEGKRGQNHRSREMHVPAFARILRSSEAEKDRMAGAPRRRNAASARPRSSI